ncbi:MAG TPA: hypothetical protein VM260_25145 [Pirellula sp.]|nr:hypothetical protein [Pirellula sp.]
MHVTDTAMVNKLRESNLNQNAVATYLSDHRGGAATAIQIVERLIVQTDNPSFKHCLERLLEQIKNDIEVLEQIAKSYPTNTSWFKRFLGWFVGILSGVKFHKSIVGRFGEFEAVEFISLGILGKRALWRILKEFQFQEFKSLAIDLDCLIQSAQTQFDEVEAWRLTLGKNALSEDITA